MNSSIEIAEALKLAKKLIDRTREGRVQWEADGPRLMTGSADQSGATGFTTLLEGDLKAKVSTMKQGQDEMLAFSLVEFSTRGNLLAAPVIPDKDVLSVVVERDPSFGYDSAEERLLAGLLIDLYSLARRSALKIDGSVEKALTYLDKLAV